MISRQAPVEMIAGPYEGKHNSNLLFKGMMQETAAPRIMAGGLRHALYNMPTELDH